ncbi:hypothetical protein SAMN04489764_4523 [Thermostaphylospora chromogena]|uniref:Actinobacteria/chloroflexi VLRF1 release factor domain-containing protein n=1 Tax=Thermostaphylospora chromogena TaxID=35622 RepID=A0A1H1HJN8_9ACTN|nr:hypothetical protein SAMN04489764_4523 [Thermostaphylospora chromogena]
MPPERVERWIAGFAARHAAAEPQAEPSPEPQRRVRASAREWGVLLEAPDGAVAECHAPFPPFVPEPGADPVAALVEHVSRERRVGVLLVRLGGYAAGFFVGDVLVDSKVGARLVQGRTAAGGWSQQRFARRREEQAAKAHAAAADAAARVLLPRLPETEAVVLGGDRRAVDALRADRRLAPLFERAVEPFLTVPDPRKAVLVATPADFRALRVRVLDPG